MKLKYIIDTNKGITCIVILMILAVYHKWQNPAAWVYLAPHGTYGLLWVLKSNIFPDASWEPNISLWIGLLSWFSLVLHWFPAWWILWKGVTSPPWLLAFAVSLNASGTFYIFSGEIQKLTELKLLPGELITDGLFRLSRTINYFGEFPVYLGFALLPLAAFNVTFWLPNMVRKDRVIATIPGLRHTKRILGLSSPSFFQDAYVQ